MQFLFNLIANLIINKVWKQLRLLMLLQEKFAFYSLHHMNAH